LLVASIIPLALRLARGGPRDWGLAAFCILACVGVAAGQAVHMAQSKAALGFVGTPVWYAAIALPWLFVGLVWSWNFDERLRRIATTSFFALLLVSEIVGVFFSWLPTVADSYDPLVVFERCSMLAGGNVLFTVGASGFLGVGSPRASRCSPLSGKKRLEAFDDFRLSKFQFAEAVFGSELDGFFLSFLMVRNDHHRRCAKLGILLDRLDDLRPIGIVGVELSVDQHEIEPGPS